MVWLLYYWLNENPFLGGGGDHGCIISSLLPFVSYMSHCEDAELDFHLHLFSISWGHRGRRLTLHNISNHITCNRSNAVIILGPYSSPSNECKSTPSLLASDSSWQWGCYSYNQCLFHPLFFPVHFWKAYSLPAPLLLFFLSSRWVASSRVSLGLIFN